MHTFVINKTSKSNNNNKTSIRSNFSSGPNISAIRILPTNTASSYKNDTDSDQIYNPQIKLNYGSNVRIKQDSQVISINNYAKVIKIRRDTSPIRNNLYNFYKDRFKQPVIVDRFEFCSEQKISTIFSSNSYNQWFSTLITNEPSFKTHLFNKVFSNSLLSLSDDCSCRYIDFSGSYILDRNLSTDNQLVQSSNKRASKASIDFNMEENYINIYLYSKKSKSYINIRLRPPLRYRPAYDDWVFDEDVTIYDMLSNTEYAELIDCCNLENGKIFNN